MLVVSPTLAIYPELGLLLIEGERNKDKLILVVAVFVVARHYNAASPIFISNQAPLVRVSMLNRPSHSFKARTERKSERKSGVKAGVAVLARESIGSQGTTREC